jgi:RNA recognition motif-containing protein
MGLRDGMELVELPDTDKERIKLNKEEGKPVGFVGDSKLYVGNVAFECSPTDMMEEFAAMGVVGDVAMVYDNETGRPRGFAFVTMRTKEGADKALAELNGKDIMGRQISVREANN